MRCKVIVGKRVLIPTQDVDPVISDLMLGLIQKKYPGAKRVPAR